MLKMQASQFCGEIVSMFVEAETTALIAAMVVSAATEA